MVIKKPLLKDSISPLAGGRKILDRLGVTDLASSFSSTAPAVSYLVDPRGKTGNPRGGDKKSTSSCRPDLRYVHIALKPLTAAARPKSAHIPSLWRPMEALLNDAASNTATREKNKEGPAEEGEVNRQKITKRH